MPSKRRNSVTRGVHFCIQGNLEPPWWMEPSKLDHSDIKPAHPGVGRGCQPTQRGATADRHLGPPWVSQVLALSRPAARLSMYRLRSDPAAVPLSISARRWISLIGIRATWDTGRLVAAVSIY